MSSKTILRLASLLVTLALLAPSPVMAEEVRGASIIESAQADDEDEAGEEDADEDADGEEQDSEEEDGDGEEEAEEEDVEEERAEAEDDDEDEGDLFTDARVEAFHSVEVGDPEDRFLDLRLDAVLTARSGANQFAGSLSAALHLMPAISLGLSFGYGLGSPTAFDGMSTGLQVLLRPTRFTTDGPAHVIGATFAVGLGYTLFFGTDFSETATQAYAGLGLEYRFEGGFLFLAHLGPGVMTDGFTDNPTLGVHGQLGAGYAF